MTHELKTPIATISLALEAIGKPQVKNNEDRFSDYTRILKEENKKLNDHVERVLQMAQLEKGELRLAKKETDLVSLLLNSIATYKLQILEQNAEVHFTPPSEKIIINADEEHLQTVFNNLLDNALKYSQSGCTITIVIIKEAGEISITFKDNGMGMGPEQSAKAFEKFYRAQGGNLHDVKGFGLGLSYVRSIVEAHGGTVKLKSEKGKGSEFTIGLKC
jgi:two-component system phosphate regulon sensor histidine kinase PhoR